LRELPAEWYAFTNLELIQTGSMPRQIDVVLVLDDRIIIADLKDWGGRITSDGDRWFQNDRSVDTSPVKKILENARIMASLLSSFLAKKAASKGVKFDRREIPLIEGCVILTGRCDIRGLPDIEKPRVLPIDEFCRTVQDRRLRNSRFAQPHWIDKTNHYTAANSKWRSMLGEFFGVGGGYFKLSEKLYGDYRVLSDSTYEHPKKIYSEYDVEEVAASRSSGLLRYWDFSKADSRYASEEARIEIAGREQTVISFLIDRQPELETVLIRPRIADSNKGIHYWEVFEKRRHLRRLGEFLKVHTPELTPASRIDLARTILSHVAGMHRLGAAHLDLGPHSIWMELPSVIRISHLVAAAYPELGTLGDRRYEFLANGTILPESILGDAVDHFRKDVFLLGVIAHMILFGCIPKSRTLADPPAWDVSIDPNGNFHYLHSWFEKSLDVASAQRFANAQEMLDAFNGAIHSATGAGGAIERLLRFRRWKGMLDLNVALPVREVLRETDRILVWRSERDGVPCLVKAWRRACWGDESAEAPRLARFCETAEDLILAEPPGIARVLDVGYLTDHLVLVQQWIDAPNLFEHLRDHREEWKDPKFALTFVEKLATAIVTLHAGGRAHGDLKPANVLVVADECGSPVLVDVLEFGPAEEGEIRTPAYSPSVPVGSKERDRFAVLKMTEEILQYSEVDTAGLQTINSSLNICRDQLPILATLDPLLEAIARVMRPPTVPSEVLTISAPGLPAGRFSSDEGRYYIRVFSPERFYLTGAMEELAVTMNRYKQGEIYELRRRPVTQSKVALAQKRATTEFFGEINIQSGLRDFSAFKPILEMVSAKVRDGVTTSTEPEAIDQPVTLPADALDEDAIVDPTEDIVPALESVNVSALWQTLMQVEQEQFTEGVADLDSYFSRERRRHFVAFHVRKGTIDFMREDKVVIEFATKSKGWVPIGVLDLDLTRNDLIAVDASAYRARDGGLLCSAGSELRFRSMMETDSRARRNAATARLVSRKSLIPNLVDYFSPLAENIPVEMPILTSVNELQSRYGLNDSQSKAFLSIWAKRPIGLLQGPPGTGKTKFIAALVHHALSSGSIRNVLLSSQSHEAVNNAAEGVLRLFRKDGAEPSIVRIGQEGNVSDVLKPYHSAKIEAHYREQFRAGLKQRFHLVAKHIGLSVSFTDDLFFMESTVRPVFAQLQSLVQAAPDEPGVEDRERRIQSLIRTLKNLEPSVSVPPSAERDWTGLTTYDAVMEGLVEKHAIDSREHVRRLRAIATLARDWLGSVSSRRRSFEEFLAKTRQIVSGTCVGLGRSSLGLPSTRFDLVIIDEAARCTPSELAVPMQAGRWIVLVGDHLQLEPFHEPIVIREAQRRLQIPRREVIRSDFERAFASSYGKLVGETLLTQYRMLPSIGRLVSNVFYGKTLKHGRTTPIVPPEAWPDDLKKQLYWITTDEIGEHGYQHPGGPSGKSLSNPAEANAIIDVLRRLDRSQPFLEWLAACDADSKPIGIICMYAAQRELVRQKLRSVGLSGTILNSCKIDTVDSYQGKENSIVILSLVRNNADGPSEGGRQTIAQGFLARGNRVNVALSRAMDKLIVVGASEAWPSDSPLARVASEFNVLSRDGESEFLKAAKWEPEPKRIFKMRHKRAPRKGASARGRDRHE
jgi:serine/threonine protein kinase